MQTATYLTTDASGYGISAVLSQTDAATGEEHPIFFLSRKLSDLERTYSVSEKEFLAVLWSIERLHQFLYGRFFTLRTDHQCLKQLLTNGVEGGAAPCRVIRWATKLLQYNFAVSYIPGKQNFVADALSRIPHQDFSHMELLAVSLSTDSLHPLTLKELVEETNKDLALQEVIEFTKNGWPTNTSTLSNSSKGFYNVRHELSYINGILCRGNKYVIPASLYDLIVRFAHEGHLGMTKTKSRIREHYWWPNLNSCVETMIRSCPCCRDTPRDSPVQVPSYVNKPWHQLAIDIKGPVFDAAHRKYFIIVLIDCYSKLAFTRAVPNASTAKIIEFLNSIFSTFGHATILTSDNGPQFISTDFTSFLRRKGIISNTPPFFHF